MHSQDFATKAFLIRVAENFTRKLFGFSLTEISWSFSLRVKPRTAQIFIVLIIEKLAVRNFFHKYFSIIGSFISFYNVWFSLLFCSVCASNRF